MDDLRTRARRAADVIPRNLGIALLLACFAWPAVCADNPPKSEPEEKNAKPVEPKKINPFGRRKRTIPGAVEGEVHTSDGKVHKGQIYMTRGKALRVFDPKACMYREFRLRGLIEIRVNVVKERIEKDWRWKEGGSDVKLFTGKTYPRRDYNLTIIPKRGKPFDTNITAGMPIYLKPEKGKKKRFLIQAYNKGPIGGTLRALVYPKRIICDPEAAAKREQKAAKAKKLKSPPSPAEKKEAPARAGPSMNL